MPGTQVPDAPQNNALQFKARLAGAAYLSTMIFAPLAMYLRGNVIVREDAMQTAANILSHPGVFRLCFAADLFAGVAYLLVTVLLYELLRPVNRTISLLAATMSVMGSAVSAVGLALPVIAVRLLGDSSYLHAFTPQQVKELALFAVRMAGVIENVGIIFFGFYCLLVGYLLLRSTFLPHLLGAGMMLAGAGWLTFLYFPLPGSVFRITEFTGFLGEGSLTFYLLFKGLNVVRWREQSAQAEQRLPG